MKRLFLTLALALALPLPASASIEFCDLLLIKQSAGIGGGDVLGPDSATNNGVCRFDLLTGKVIQDSTNVTISDDGRLDLQSTTEALVLNRINTTARDALPLTDGTLLYNTTAQEFQGREGGVWRHLGEWPNGWVAVNSMDDFPAPVAGTITLEEDMLYVLGADLSTADEFVVEDNVAITAGSVLGASLTYTDTGVMFTGVDVSFEIYDIHVQCPSGTCFDFSDTVGQSSVVLMRDVSVNPSVNFGTFDDLSVLQMIRVSSSSSGTGLGLVGGPWNTTSIVESVFLSSSATYVGIDLNSSTHGKLELSELSFGLFNPGGVGVSGAGASGNIIVGQIATLMDTQFIGPGAPIAGISSADARWNIQRSPPIKPSQVIGCYKMAGNATVTTNAGLGLDSKVLGTTVACAENERFTMSGNNELEVTAEFPFSAKLTINIGAKRSSGNGGQETEYMVFKDSGAGFVELDTDAVSTLDQDARTKGVSLEVRDTFSQGDKYSVYTRNLDSGTTTTLVVSLQVDVEASI